MSGKKIISGVILDESYEFTLEELVNACTMDSEWIISLVEEGVIEPMGEDVRHWRFSSTCLQRVTTIRNLQRDLGVNLAGAALALELMDKIEELHTRLSILENNVQNQ